MRYQVSQYLKTILAPIAYEVQDSFVYIDEVHNFPSIFFYPVSETIVHSLTNERFSQLTYVLRGYTYDEEVEESGEALSAKIEDALKNYDRELIEDIRLIDIETDGGINYPEGVVIIEFTVLINRGNQKLREYE